MQPRPNGPLSHLKVLDLSRLHPGAFCSLLLADLGADVLKIEAPGIGDGMRYAGAEGFMAAHVAFNRGKRSMRLDLKHPRAPEVLRRLLRGVDVVIESQKPGFYERMGLGFEQVRADNPGLIWCALTGFGPTGPNADAPGHDITYLGIAGVMSQMRVNGVPPVPDIVLSVPLGALMGAVGILSALEQRRHSGRGARVDAALAEAAGWLLSEGVARAAAAPGPGWGAFAARMNYRCADERWVTVAASEPRPWARLCAALDLPDLANHVHGTDEPATIARLAEAFARRPSAHWIVEPGLAGGVGPVNEPADMLADPHLAARRSIVEIAGGARVLANPVRLDGADGEASTCARGAPPELGADTDAALAAAGFGADEIAVLHAEGVV
ncbi:MAG: CaiB/BaiF CoA transferase family protein [Gammaproteobacteria bacterium]